MRFLIAITLALLVAPKVSMAQSVVLSLDATPKNRCEGARQGAMWTLHDPPPPANAAPGLTVVTLLRSDDSGSPPRTISYTLSSGQTVELDCCQGTSPVSYRLVDQK